MTTTAPAAAPAAPVIIAEPVPGPSWLTHIKSPKDVKRPRSIMLYGLPGRRKTSILGSIAEVPGINKVLFIDIDQGTEVLARKKEFEKIDIIQISALAPNAVQMIDKIVDDVCASDMGYDAVCFDTLDVAQDAVEREAEREFATASKSGGRDGFAVYRAIGEWTERTVRKLHESPYFVAVIACHSAEKTLESGAIRIMPRLSGSTKDTIGGIPSLVAYVEFKTDPEGNRRLLASVGEQDDMITKNRFDLPEYIPDITMPILYGMIDSHVIPEETALATNSPTPTTAATVAA